MEITRYQLLRAAAYTRSIVKSKIGTSIADINTADMAVLNKYLDLEVIKFTPKKINYSREVYFPTMESKRLKGISVDFWRVCVRQLLQNAGHSVNLSKASAADYMSKDWKYKIAPTCILRSYASFEQKKLEKATLVELFNTEGGY